MEAITLTMKDLENHKRTEKLKDLKIRKIDTAKRLDRSERRGQIVYLSNGLPNDKVQHAVSSL